MKRSRKELKLNPQIPFVAADIMLEQLGLINQAIEKTAEEYPELERVLPLFKAAFDQFNLAFNEYKKILEE